MEQKVRVLQAYEDGTAQVVLVRQSACSGDCHKCSGCGAATETVTFTARNLAEAGEGDVVCVESPSAPVLADAAVCYMIPLVLFFAGYLAGHLLWQQGAAAGGAAFALGVAGAVCYDRLVVKKRETVYTITRVLKKA